MLLPNIKQDTGDVKKENNDKHFTDPGDIQRTLYVIILFNPCSNSTSRYFNFPYFTDETKDCSEGHIAVEPGSIGNLVAELY